MFTTYLNIGTVYQALISKSTERQKTSDVRQLSTAILNTILNINNVDFW
jgi:hypothetical protein